MPEVGDGAVTGLELGDRRAVVLLADQVAWGDMIILVRRTT